MQDLFYKLVKDEHGVAAIEYGIVVVLIAVAILTALNSVGAELADAFNSIENNLDKHKVQVAEVGTR